MARMAESEGIGNRKVLNVGLFSCRVVAVFGLVAILSSYCAGASAPKIREKSSEAALVTAARAGDARKIESLVGAGADVNVRDSSGATPLYFAVLSGDERAVAALVSAHADVNVEYANRWSGNITPLGAACALGNPSIVKLLLNAGADPNALDGHEGSPLIAVVAASGDIDIVKLLVSHGARVDVSDKEGFTPALRAAANGRREVVAYLLADGAQQDLWTACATGDLDYIAGTLGWDKSTVSSFLALTETDSHLALHISGVPKPDESIVSRRLPDGQMPLHIAAECGSVSATKLLIAAGAPVNAGDDSSETPLHKAAKLDRVGVIDVLVGGGAAHLEARDSGGLTSLALAVECGSVDAARRLIAAGANIEARDDSGATPLLVAAQHGQTNAARLLIEHGANVRAEGAHRWTALYYAVFVPDRTSTDGQPAKGNPALAELLLKHGAVVDSHDDQGLTPLDEAAREGNLPLVELLLKGGADPAAKTPSGKTPEQIATEMKFPRVAAALAKASRNPGTR